MIKCYFHPTPNPRKAPIFLDGANFPNISLWLAAIAARPAIRCAMAIEFSAWHEAGR